MALSAIHQLLRTVFLSNNQLQQLPVNFGGLQSLECLGDVRRGALLCARGVISIVLASRARC